MPRYTQQPTSPANCEQKQPLHSGAEMFESSNTQSLLPIPVAPNVLSRLGVTLLQQQVGNQAVTRLLRQTNPGARAVAPRMKRQVLQAQPAAESRARSHFIVDDSAEAGADQIGKTAFLRALRSAIEAIASDILGAVGRTVDDCPYIPYWFALYESKSPSHIETALGKYAPGASNASRWEDFIDVVSERVKIAFEKNIKTGSLEGVPDDVPRQLEPTAAAGEATVQRCGSCFGSAAEPQYIELAPVSNLPDWGSAQVLGYHVCTPEVWAMIQQTGEFRPGPEDAQLGAGWYLSDDPEGMQSRYTAYTIMLEVGYIGGDANFVRRVKGDTESRPQLREDQALNHRYDVLETTRGVGQQESCYRPDGPAHIAVGNWRVRKISELKDRRWTPPRK
jgi:hypothetical protein